MAATAEKSTVAAFENEGHILRSFETEVHICHLKMWAVIPKCVSSFHSETVVIPPSWGRKWSRTVGQSPRFLVSLFTPQIRFYFAIVLYKKFR